MKKENICNIPEPICGIHTTCLKINGFIPPDISDRAKACISKEITYVDKGTGETGTRIILNANKWYGDNGWCKSYVDYRYIYSEILGEIGNIDDTPVRVDFALNFVEDNYDCLHKLHKCICLLAAHKYEMMNKYESIDPLKLEHLTTRVQNEYIEIENYNKKIESSGKSQFSNRLEFRSKALNQTKTRFQSVEKLVDDWIQRCNSFVAEYEPMTMECNRFLLNRWSREQGTIVKDMSEFVRKYQDNIFSLEQLTALYSELGVNNPKGSAKNFIRYNEIEFISKNALTSYFYVIDKSMREYISKGAVIALESEMINCA